MCYAGLRSTDLPSGLHPPDPLLLNVLRDGLEAVIDAGIDDRPEHSRTNGRNSRPLRGETQGIAPSDDSRNRESWRAGAQRRYLSRACPIVLQRWLCCWNDRLRHNNFRRC